MREIDLQFTPTMMDEFACGFNVHCRLCKKSLGTVVRKEDANTFLLRFAHVCEPDWIDVNHKLPMFGALCLLIYEDPDNAPLGLPSRHFDIGWYSGDLRWVKRSGNAGRVTFWSLIPDKPERVA